VSQSLPNIDLELLFCYDNKKFHQTFATQIADVFSLPEDHRLIFTNSLTEGLYLTLKVIKAA